MLSLTQYLADTHFARTTQWEKVISERLFLFINDFMQADM